jgi:hypothetical protein
MLEFSWAKGRLWKKAKTFFLENNKINWETPASGTYSLNAKKVQEWILLGDPSLKYKDKTKILDFLN